MHYFKQYLGKGIRLDVYVEEENNTIYNIEVQTPSKDNKYLGKRIRYYQALIDSAILDRGNDYVNEIMRQRGYYEEQIYKLFGSVEVMQKSL